MSSRRNRQFEALANEHGVDFTAEIRAVNSYPVAVVHANEIYVAAILR